MELIIHIGTHKTGTSSLQTFLATNRSVLIKHGIYYPESAYSGRNVNFMPSRIATGHYDEVNNFLKNSIIQAKKRKLDKILISAESFYAMTTFFQILDKKQITNYWEYETECIKKLQSFLVGIDVKIVCYLRRQDEFITSMYNQMVKQASGYTGSIDEFISEAGAICNYSGHIKLWADIFGDEAIVVRRFVINKDWDINKDFLATALRNIDISQFKPIKANVNIRLDPNMLAFKRIINRLNLPLAEDYVVYKLITRMVRNQKKPNKHKSLLSQKKRQSLINQFEPGNKLIQEKWLSPHEDPLFSIPDTRNIQIDYATTEISLEHGLELFMRYQRERKKPLVIMEIVIRRVFRALITRVPAIELFLGTLRQYINRRRVIRESKGLE